MGCFYKENSLIFFSKNKENLENSINVNRVISNNLWVLFIHTINYQTGEMNVKILNEKGSFIFEGKSNILSGLGIKLNSCILFGNNGLTKSFKGEIKNLKFFFNNFINFTNLIPNSCSKKKLSRLIFIQITFNYYFFHNSFFLTINIIKYFIIIKNPLFWLIYEF